MFPFFGILKNVLLFAYVRNYYIVTGQNKRNKQNNPNKPRMQKQGNIFFQTSFYYKFTKFHKKAR